MHDVMFVVISCDIGKIYGYDKSLLKSRDKKGIKEFLHEFPTRSILHSFLRKTDTREHADISINRQLASLVSKLT